MDRRIGLSAMRKVRTLYPDAHFVKAQEQSPMALLLSKGRAARSHTESPRKLTAERIGLKQPPTGSPTGTRERAERGFVGMPNARIQRAKALLQHSGSRLGYQ